MIRTVVIGTISAQGILVAVKNGLATVDTGMGRITGRLVGALR